MRNKNPQNEFRVTDPECFPAAIAQRRANQDVVVNDENLYSPERCLVGEKAENFSQSA
jgi:hypothetical protein